MNTAVWKIAVLLSVFVLITGCGDGSDTVTTTQTETPATPETPSNCTGGTLNATWGCIQDFVLTPSCAKSGCHGDAFPQQGLILTAASSPGIVGRASTEQPSLNIIQSGDPDNSYLIRKIEGDPSISFERMPLGGPFLDNPTIQIMRDWVTAGALVP